MIQFILMIAEVPMISYAFMMILSGILVSTGDQQCYQKGELFRSRQRDKY